MKGRSVSLALFIVLLLSGLNFSDKTLVVTEGRPVLDGVLSEGEWTSEPLVTARGATLYAMADGAYLYVAATWADSTESVLKDHLAFDGTSWTKSGDEDRLSFVFDMGGPDGANCQAMCHFPDMKTNGGQVDVWHWKAARSNPMGISEDKYWDETGRHGDGGTSANRGNALDGATGLPAFMAEGDPGKNARFMVESADALAAFDPFGTVASHVVTQAVNFESAVTFAAGDFIPGYLLRSPSGDIADVAAAGKWEDGVWTVEFRRAYSGGEHDFEVVAGGKVDFTLELFDNQGANHGLDDTPVDLTIYTLDFADIVATSLEPVANTTPNSYRLNGNYPNPFNPSTAIAFSVADRAAVKLSIFDLSGREIETLVNEVLEPGEYRVHFRPHGASGIYFYKLMTDHYSETRSMVFMK